jgi:hypothetical protein
MVALMMIDAFSQQSPIQENIIRISTIPASIILKHDGC